MSEVLRACLKLRAPHGAQDFTVLNDKTRFCQNTIAISGTMTVDRMTGHKKKKKKKLFICFCD